MGFAAADAVTGLKLIEEGVPKERLALLGVPMVPIQIMLPLLISKYTSGPRPMDMWLKAIPYRWVLRDVYPGTGGYLEMYTLQVCTQTQGHVLKAIPYRWVPRDAYPTSVYPDPWTCGSRPYPTGVYPTQAEEQIKRHTLLVNNLKPFDSLGKTPERKLELKSLDCDSKLCPIGVFRNVFFEACVKSCKQPPQQSSDFPEQQKKSFALPLIPSSDFTTITFPATPPALPLLYGLRDFNAVKQQNIPVAG